MSAFEMSLSACAVCRDTDRAMHILKILTTSEVPISNTIKTKCIDVCVWDRHGHVISREILDKIDRHNKNVRVEDDDLSGDRVKQERIDWNESEKELRLHFLEAKRGKKVDVKTWLLELENLESKPPRSAATAAGESNSPTAAEAPPRPRGRRTRDDTRRRRACGTRSSHRSPRRALRPRRRPDHHGKHPRRRRRGRRPRGRPASPA